MKLLLSNNDGTVVSTYQDTEFVDVHDMLEGVRDDIPILENQGALESPAWRTFSEEDEDA